AQWRAASTLTAVGAIGLLTVRMWCATPALSAAVAPETSAPATRPTPRIVEAILTSVRRPADGQFPTPEAVVRFFIAQVASQDVDEAIKAFPVVEAYERNDFRGFTRQFQVFDPNGPLPDAPFRNISVALRSLAGFDYLSLKMLGVKVYMRQPTNMMKPGEPEQLEAKLDRSRLKDLEVTSLKTLATTPTKPDVPLGYTQIARLQAGLKCGQVKADVEFTVVQLRTNWRVLDVSVSD